MTEPYFTRLTSVTAARGALCVGVDPHPQILQAWGLPVDAAGVERLAMTMAEALGEQVAVFKPQSAFFEMHGSRGIAVLEKLIIALRERGALVIMDAKRGDIGSTMAAYAQAYLANGSPLAVDALTVSPFLGFGSLQPAIDLADATGRGLYVLARTSNPEGASVQLSVPDGAPSLSQLIIDAARDHNAATELNSIGVVVGGTHADLGCDVSGMNGSILVPGIGAQGGRVADLPELFGAAAALVLPSASREVMAGGPSPAGLRARVSQLIG